MRLLFYGEIFGDAVVLLPFSSVQINTRFFNVLVEGGYIINGESFDNTTPQEFGNILIRTRLSHQ